MPRPIDPFDITIGPEQCLSGSTKASGCREAALAQKLMTIAAQEFASLSSEQ